MIEAHEQLLSCLAEGATLDIRADGKAGSGLVMVMQVFAEAVSTTGRYHVQEWPLFSSARKGANVRGFMRIRQGEIHLSCQIERPHLAILLNEKTGEEIDFAIGMDSGVFIVNTPKPPREIAEKFGLQGEVFTVPGDQLGQQYLGQPIPNIAVLAALQRVLPLVTLDQINEALLDSGKKRRLPQRIIEANQDCLQASLEVVRQEKIPATKGRRHPLLVFAGYDNYPIGSQSRLRTSRVNRTANYARAGRRLVFNDPQDRCTGCSLCIINCPEGIIRYEPEERRGLYVTGADVDQFCKLCRECIEVCPLDLFQEIGAQG